MSTKILVICLILAYLGLVVPLLVVLLRPRTPPPQAPAGPPGSRVTHDHIEAALSPLRDRLAVLESASERMQGQIGRATQLALREERKQSKEEEKAALMAQIAAARPVVRGAGSEGEQVSTPLARPRSRMLKRFG